MSKVEAKMVASGARDFRANQGLGHPIVMSKEMKLGAHTEMTQRILAEYWAREFDRATGLDRASQKARAQAAMMVAIHASLAGVYANVEWLYGKDEDIAGPVNFEEWLNTSEPRLRELGGEASEARPGESGR